MKKCLLLLSFIGYFNFCTAQAGRLDTTFGVNGITTTDIGSVAKHNRIGKQVLVQSDTALYFISEENKIMHITKKHMDGLSDLSYGKRGVSASVSMYVVQAALQTDGKIVVVGYFTIPDQQYDNTHIIIARINTNGNLDNTFNKNGIAVLNNSYNEIPTSMAIQKDGKIVLAGYTYSSTLAFYGNRYLLYRVNTDGTPDLPFSKNGIMENDYIEKYTALTIQDDGKILTASSRFSSVYQVYNLSLTRYKLDGTVDTIYYASKQPSYPVAFNSKFITILKSGKIIVAGNSNNDFALAGWSKEGLFETLQTTDFNKNNDVLNGFVLQNNEDIILSGSSKSITSSSFAIAKFTSDLKPDNSFSIDGKLTTEFNTNQNFANGIAVQTDGKLIVVGYVINGTESSTAIVRYNMNGTPDSNFAVNGKLIENLNQGATKYTCTVVQKDGKIVTGGQTMLNDHTAFALARYNNNGRLDETFGKGGIQINDFGNSKNIINSIAIQSDGKIIAGGSSNRSLAIARYNTNGSLDNTFAKDGVNKDIFNFNDYTNSIIIQPDGKILTAGSVLARFKTNGTLDSTFNHVGHLTPILPYNGIPNFVSIAVQKNGNILVLNDFYNQTPTVIKYFKNGQSDSTFSENGQAAIYDFDRGRGQSLILQNDEKIVVGGYLEEVDRSTNSSYLITRLNNNGKIDSTFNKGQVVRTSIAMRDYGKSLKIQNDNKIILAGYSYTDQAHEVFSMVRYNTNGSLDNSFNNNGRQTTAASGANSRINEIYISGNNLYAAGYGEFPNNFGVVAKYLLCTKEETSLMRLINFKAELQNRKTKLTWEVENEFNLVGFDVQRSSDSINFTSIGNVAGKGNTPSKTYYSSEDENPLTGINYYRLKLVKTDSNYVYSPLVNINLCDKSVTLKIYPNPAKNTLLISGNLGNEKVILQVIDNNGTKLREIKTTLNGSTSIDIHSLPNGMYNLKISSKTSTFKIKFIKE